jgi:MFS family permease
MTGALASSDTSPESITPRELRTVLLSCMIGTTVEWYDFFLYGVAAGIVFNQLFFPSQDPVVGTLLAFATFAIGFVARPVGGLLFGHIGDRVGRKGTLIATMLLMGVATFLIGVLPTHESMGTAAPVLLIVLRLLQGLAVGGEWGGAVLMAVEYAPSGRRGVFGSIPQMGLALGLIMGTGVFALLEWILDDRAFLAWGWRIAFMLSAVLVIVGLVIRLKVLETPAFRKLEEREARAAVPAVDLFRSRLSRRHILLGMGARWIEGVIFNAFAVFAISYGVSSLGTTRETMLTIVLGSAAVLLVLIPVFGHLSDRLGQRRLYAVGAALCAIATVPAFALMGTENRVWIAVAVVASLGVLYPIMYAPEAALFASLFPPSVRYTGISFVYQFSGIFASGLTPLVFTWLLDRGPGTTLVLAYCLVVGAVSTVCTLAIRDADLAVTEEQSAVLEGRT